MAPVLLKTVIATILQRARMRPFGRAPDRVVSNFMSLATPRDGVPAIRV
jgi:hypothetical protein